ncbi:hypothetical protein ACA910_010642 [Epithemia clementina (nom. ined.)]
MNGKLDSVLKALESVDREINDLEKKLGDARRRKADLMKEKTSLEQSSASPPKAAPKLNGQSKDAPESEETPEELQARIAELQRQIEEAERQKKVKAMARARSRSPSGRKLVGDGAAGRGGTRSPQGGSRRQLVKPGSPRARTPSNRAVVVANSSAATARNSAPPAADDEKKSGGWNLFGSRGRKGGADNEGSEAEPSPAPSRNETSTNSDPASSSPPKENVAPAAEAPSSEQAGAPGGEPAARTILVGSQAPADWERPGWAHAMNKHDNRAVDSDPIANPLLQHAENSGYRRQVFAKDLELEKGTLMKHQARAPDPRLTWIVVRINGTGVPGKIVMHLHGKDVHNLVDHFVALKDTSFSLGGPNRASLTVHCEPPLYITTTGPQGLDAKSGVFGVVQEGHEIIDKVLGAGEGAEFSIKQAHIFPVKKSKGGI